MCLFITEVGCVLDKPIGGVKAVRLGFGEGGTVRELEPGLEVVALFVLDRGSVGRLCVPRETLDHLVHFGEEVHVEVLTLWGMSTSFRGMSSR